MVSAVQKEKENPTDEQNENKSQKYHRLCVLLLLVNMCVLITYMIYHVKTSNQYGHDRSRHNDRNQRLKENLHDCVFKLMRDIINENY